MTIRFSWQQLRWGLLFLVSLLPACGQEAKPLSSPGQTYEVKKEALHKTLHFSGHIQPLRESLLSTPVDALVESLHSHYGQAVKKGELVFSLSSNELQQQYNESLTGYLKAKDSLSIAQAKFNGTQELWDAGLLSKNSYLSEKSSLDNARMSLMQATGKLAEMLEKTGETTASLTELSLAEFDKVRGALTARHNTIQLRAPFDGILLYPPKATEDKTGRISTGSHLKAGQLLGLIGDLSGISIEIEISEIDIDKIYRGMPAIVRGLALGRQVLEGQVVAVNAQASTNANSGLASFSALVEVSPLTEEQQAAIKVGMSATVELRIEKQDQLLVPIAAIRQQKGQTRVTVSDPEKGLISRVISTGAAQVDKVVVTSGLQEGERVVYD